MRVAIWQTDHEISQTVSNSLAIGFKAPIFNTSDVCEFLIKSYDCHIAYGILRGAADVFRRADAFGKLWFNVDRGYFNPNHYDGFYRLSFRGTQAKWHANGPKRQHSLELEPARELSGHILICPPSNYVAQFYPDATSNWGKQEFISSGNEIWRYKGDPNPIVWDKIKLVATFNSSLGWEAMRRGIPVISDPQHSVVGSYQATKPIDTWDRNELFDFMRAHDFTLSEIEQGKAWPLIQHYLQSSLDTTPENPSLQKLPNSPSSAEQSSTFQSIFSATAN